MGLRNDDSVTPRCSRGGTSRSDTAGLMSVLTDSFEVDSVKTFLCSVVALLASAGTASAITVSSPANGAQVTSPFEVVASATTCGSVPVVAMGYSIDHGQAVIEPVSFSASVVAPQGNHVLHVKCWGKKTSDEVLLNINVASSAAATDIRVVNPANGVDLTSPFNLSASVTNCGSSPATGMGYAIDGHPAVNEPSSFTTAVTANPGHHVLHVKCMSRTGSDQVLLNIHVITPPPTATPVFSLVSGSYAKSQIVALADATPGAIIHYTIDGSTPSANSAQYTGPISVTASMTIQAIAIAPSSSPSRVAGAQYVIVAASGPTIPANAHKQTDIQVMPDWRIKHDPATPGSAAGAMSVVSDPALSGQADRFVTSFTDAGGVLYSLTYGNDPVPHNFVYDAMVWIDGSSQIGNLEMDNNQVAANGDTIIYAFQCAGTSGVWEYSENAGTPAHPQVKWLRSNQPCNPAKWTPNAWHHVQISYSRDDAGNVTYHSVWLDGAEAPINKTVNSAFTLHWAAGALVTNFQIDGIGVSGGSTLYLDNLTVYSW